MPLRTPFKREFVVTSHVQLLHLRDPPKSFHGDYAVTGMFLVMSSAIWLSHSHKHNGITTFLPTVGLLHWVFLAPGLPISKADIFSEQDWSLRHFLPNPLCSVPLNKLLDLHQSTAFPIYSYSSSLNPSQASTRDLIHFWLSIYSQRTPNDTFSQFLPALP